MLFTNQALIMLAWGIKSIQESFMVIRKRGETLSNVRGLKNISFHVLAHHVRNVCIVMPRPHTMPCDCV